MKLLTIFLTILFLVGCEERTQRNQLQAQQLDGRYRVFEVEQYGLVCVSGGSAQLSCVNKEKAK